MHKYAKKQTKTLEIKTPKLCQKRHIIGTKKDRKDENSKCKCTYMSKCNYANILQNMQKY